MRNRRSALIWLFLSTFSVTALVTFALHARASFDRRVHAAACRVAGVDANAGITDQHRGYFFQTFLGDVFSPGIQNRGGQTSQGGARFMELFCPIPNDTCMSAPSVTQVNVHGLDNNPDPPDAGQTKDVRVWACRLRWDTNEGDCGTEAKSSGQGEYTLSPGLESWWNAADFNYLYIRVPNPKGTTQPLRSTVRGFWINGSGGCR